MDEYTKLIDIMYSKLAQLNGNQLIAMSQLFKQNDPNELFENIHNIADYLSIMKQKQEAEK
jgi:hypothetical protein